MTRHSGDIGELLDTAIVLGSAWSYVFFDVSAGSVLWEISFFFPHGYGVEK